MKYCFIRLLALVDVHLGELVADAPRSGMQHDPHVVVLVQADLDEVVAGSERPELLTRLSTQTVRPVGCRCLAGSQRGEF